MAWTYPVPDTYGLYITDPFGTRRGTGIHEGTDYRAPTGTELYAIGDGYVEAVVHNDPRGGNYVRIRLDSGLVRDARYSHLSRIDVPKGKRVRTGEIIGLSGATGNVTGPHLHFGMKNNAGHYINPDAFLRGVGATAIDYAPSTPAPVLEVASSTKPRPVKDGDAPMLRNDMRTTSQKLTPNRWSTIKVTNKGGVSTAFGAREFDSDVVLQISAPQGVQVRARFYRIDYKTGKRTYTYDRESKVDSPVTKGSTLMFALSCKGQLAPTERLRVEIYTWNDGVEITNAAYRTHEWN